MPNWCYNKLSVYPTDRNPESIEQLNKFIKEACDEGEIIQFKEAKAFKEKYISEHFENRYRNDAEMFVKHSEMSPEKFLTDILQFQLKEKDNNNFFQRYDSPFRMGQFLPCPDELRNVTSPVRAENGENEEQFKDRVKRCKELYGAEDWYKWQCYNWGTKWDVSSCAIHSQTKYRIVYTYDTAWSPNTDFLYKISEKYPLLTFDIKFKEEGMGYSGEETISYGENEF